MIENLTNIPIDDYFDNEKRILAKHEYIDGNIFPILNGDLDHNVIRTNVMFEIMTAMRGKGFRVFTGDTRLWIVGDDEKETNVVYYPDIMVCKSKEAAPNYITEPLLIIEIVSEFSERQDRNEKINYYSCINQLSEYVLIDQRRKQIERYSMNRDQSLKTVIDTNKHLHFNTLGFSIDVADIYNGVNVK